MFLRTLKNVVVVFQGRCQISALISGCRSSALARLARIGSPKCASNFFGVLNPEMSRMDPNAFPEEERVLALQGVDALLQAAAVPPPVAPPAAAAAAGNQTQQQPQTATPAAVEPAQAAATAQALLSHYPQGFSPHLKESEISKLESDKVCAARRVSKGSPGHLSWDSWPVSELGPKPDKPLASTCPGHLGT